VIARVLLADDDDGVRRALAGSLSRAGFEVLAVDDGAPAIAAGEHRLYDIIVADLNMSTVGGLDVVRHYKARFGIGVCCVILSGDDGDEVRDQCFAAGADDVIAKPTSPTELRRRLIAAALVLRDRAA
jgi:CheY-like chemotaxis protein